MAAGRSVMVSGALGSEGFPGWAREQKEKFCDVILIVVSVLNLSRQEYRLKKERLG